LNGQIHEFRDLKTNFTPFKEWYEGQICEYPSKTCTEDLLTIGKTYQDNYRLEKSSPDRVLLSAELGNYTIRKEVSLQGRKMSIHYSVAAKNSEKGGEELAGKINYMLNLDQANFGLFPTLYLAMKDGRTLKHVLGSETTFTWVSEAYDLSQTTGKLVLCSGVNSRAIVIQVDPEKIPTMPYWQDKDGRGSVKDQCFMLTLFFSLKPVKVFSQKPVDINISFEVVEDYKQLNFPNVYEK